MNRLQQLAEQIAQQQYPDLSQWQPKTVGKIDIRIDANGQWFHEGSLIKREGLVTLFASILCTENNHHYLITPEEKLAIEVEQTPFVVTQADLVDGRWFLTNNLGEIQELTNASQLNFEQRIYPFIVWRSQLLARIQQNVMYQLLVHAAAHGVIKNGRCYLESGNCAIAVGQMD